MKILYISDVHDRFDYLKILSNYAKTSKPDIIQVSGDIADIAFKEPKRFENHTGMAQMIWQYMLQHEPGLKRLTPYEARRAIPIVAEKLYENPPNKDLEELAESYLRSLDFYEGNLDMRYELLKSMMEETGLEYTVIPGNHDKDLQLSCLKEKDIHKKTIEKNGIRIAGIGGANDIQYGDITPFGTPPEITIPFNEYPNSQGQILSEIFNFLTKEKPDIAFTHIPPRNIRDLAVHPMIRRTNDKTVIRLMRQGGPALMAYIQQSNNPELMKFLKNGGSVGLEEYAKQGHTKLICSGHIHESVGAEKIDTGNGPVIVFNGGSLNEGYFGEIQIDDETKNMDKISLYRIKKRLILPSYLEETMDTGNIVLLMEYFLTPGKELKKIKTDLEEPYNY